MNAALRTVESYLRATIDVGLVLLVLAAVWYPTLALGNELVGAPLEPSTLRLLVGVAALGSTYAVFAGERSLGALGEFVFALAAALIGWGLLGAVLVVASGLELSGADPRPQALLWLVANVTALVVVRTSSPLFE
ncbi:hypothetical protein [Natronomonas marina]|jgi:hypothetical protein|uniref:hypothetical protein n=1 Tax=Natronomonas marina TaxID=2961939 RepID=UPI0020C940C4|nr:hypothetical protein [Natronomonas marina]